MFVVRPAVYPPDALTDRATVPVKPSIGVTVIVVVADWPIESFMD